MEVFGLLIGTGVVGMLWRIAEKLGSIETKLAAHIDHLDDHEERIRKLEGQS